MSLRQTALLLSTTSLLLLPACNPYQNRSGDYYAGALDPAKFPLGYQGVGFAHNQSNGTFTPSDATSQGTPTAYFWLLGVNASKLIETDTQKAPLAYIFDGAVDKDSNKCVAPKNYVFDQRTDFVHFDVQSNLFQEQQSSAEGASLPDEGGYTPVYAEVPVTSNSEPCQGVKSAEGLIKDNGKTLTVALTTVKPPSTLNPVGVPDGKFLALAIIDPAADVLFPDISPVCQAQGGGGPCHDPNTDLGPQRWGFIDHMLAAYLDGGPVPVRMVTVPGMMGAPDQHDTTAVAQTLFAPNTIPNGMGGSAPVGDPTNPLGDGKDPTTAVFGHGFDVFQGTDGKGGLRTDPGYSPICHVLTYTPADPMNPPTDAAQIDMTKVDPDTSTFIYCLQLAQ
jgi:hypothetical protein